MSYINLHWTFPGSAKFERRRWEEALSCSIQLSPKDGDSSRQAIRFNN